MAFSAINYNKSFPANINKEFKSKRANLAFISSIAAKNAARTNIGIVAKGEVLSVIATPGEYRADSESATSNILAKVLGVEGNVHIGDKALKLSLGGHGYIDLSKLWFQTHKLPFVFAVLCYNKNSELAKNIAKRFKNAHIKIPQYILEGYSKNRQISKSDILNYLTKISYKIGQKEELGYKKFLKLSKEHSKTKLKK